MIETISAKELVCSLAQEALGFIYCSDSKYYLSDQAPSWVKDLIYAAHDKGRFMPDDYRYEFTYEVLDLIADGYDFEDLQPDIYTSDLLAWLNTNWRLEYLDEVFRDHEGSISIYQALPLAQLHEKEEVFHLVLKFLEDHAANTEQGDG